MSSYSELIRRWDVYIESFFYHMKFRMLLPSLTFLSKCHQSNNFSSYTLANQNFFPDSAKPPKGFANSEKSCYNDNCISGYKKIYLLRMDTNNY